jgi:hypothetical protein
MLASDIMTDHWFLGIHIFWFFIKDRDRMTISEIGGHDQVTSPHKSGEIGFEQKASKASRSNPTVVGLPWPGYRITSSGQAKTVSDRDVIDVAKASGDSV